MCHRRWVLNEGFGITETDREEAQFYRIDHPPTSLEAAGDFEADNSTAGSFAAGPTHTVDAKSGGIIHPSNRWMPFEEAGYFQRIFTVAFHTNAQRFNAAQC